MYIIQPLGLWAVKFASPIFFVIVQRVHGHFVFVFSVFLCESSLYGHFVKITKSGGLIFFFDHLL